MVLSLLFDSAAANLIVILIAAGFGSVLVRAFYNLYVHPLAGFPGPWYAGATSLVSGLISINNFEPQWLTSLAKKYGTDRPIRIAPNLLLFPKAADAKDIYCDPACNLKAEMYGSGALGPPNLFSTRDAAKHKRLRKALGGTQWSIGSLKNNWEPRIDELVNLFTRKMSELAEAQQEVVISDKVAEFAADILTMLAFTDKWGFVENSRDERRFLKSWRQGLNNFGLAARWRWYRQNILENDFLAPYFLPKVGDKFGMGYLISHADEQVRRREQAIEAAGGDFQMEQPDFLQHSLEARYDDGSPLNFTEKRAHSTILIQAGADTTGTALGCTIRYLLTNPGVLQKARAELDAADAAGKLSNPISYEESRVNLPYFGACIKESLRLNPPAPNLFGRVVPKGGKRIGKEHIPAGVDITSNAYVMQRDPALYGLDAEVYRPERWLESPHANEMDSSMFVFGMGPRVCIGKDVAMLELSKLLPEIVRNFEFDLLDVGRYVVVGGIAYNRDLRVLLQKRLRPPQSGIAI